MAPRAATRPPVRRPGLFRVPPAVFAVPMDERPVRPAGGDGSSAPWSTPRPAATQAAVTVERRSDSVLVAITGEIDLANSDTVEQEIAEGLGDGVRTVTVDLTGLDYIDSAGLWILFRLAASLTAAGITGEVVVAGDGAVRRMVETAGVSAAIAVRAAV